MATQPQEHELEPSTAPGLDRLTAITEMMRELSRQTDPQSMVRTYASRISQMIPLDVRISLSRRGMQAPWFRITRYSGWEDEVNPWTETDKLPVLEGGVLADLLYANDPTILNDFEIPPDDPAHAYLAGQRSLVAIPLFDQGESLNMVIGARREPDSFVWDELPERVWISNLFGRATHNLVMAEQLQRAYQAVDQEMATIADIQRTLLPEGLPAIPGLRLAAHYQTSHRAGGDYYDFLPLADGRWGILIADASGHGAPAAVVMAILHAVVHTFSGDAGSPRALLEYLNQKLAERYTGRFGSFITAFYAVFDPATRKLVYASAGHNPPRLKGCASDVSVLERVGGLPLGIVEEQNYCEATVQMAPGDRLILYTDGITEAHNPAGEQFGPERLDRALAHCGHDAEQIVADILDHLERFTACEPATDDRTLLVAQVT